MCWCWQELPYTKHGIFAKPQQTWVHDWGRWTGWRIPKEGREPGGSRHVCSFLKYTRVSVFVRACRHGDAAAVESSIEEEACALLALSFSVVRVLPGEV